MVLDHIFGLSVLAMALSSLGYFLQGQAIAMA
jgi:hypothetical protein